MTKPIEREEARPPEEGGLEERLHRILEYQRRFLEEGYLEELRPIQYRQTRYGEICSVGAIYSEEGADFERLKGKMRLLDHLVVLDEHFALLVFEHTDCDQGMIAMKRLSREAIRHEGQPLYRALLECRPGEEGEKLIVRQLCTLLQFSLRCGLGGEVLNRYDLERIY